MNKIFNNYSLIKLQGINKWGLILLLLSAFSYAGSAQIAQNDTIVLDRILAVVGSHPILQSDVENTLQQNRASGIPMLGDEKCSTLEDIMASKLLLDQAELDSIEKTDREVEAALQQRLNFFVEQAGSVEAIEEYFKKSMPEIKQDFFTDIKNQLLTEEMKRSLTADVRVTPSEVQKFFKKIPKDQVPRIPEQLEIRQIVQKPGVTEEEKLRVIDQLNEYRDQILAGKSMATIAILHSDDPGSRTQGGELGFYRRGDLAPEYTAAAFNLRGNEVSRVVKTDFGYHLIQVIERKGETINTRHILLKPKIAPETSLQTKNSLDSLALRIRNEELDFEKAAGLFSNDENTSANGGLMVNMNNGTTKFEPRELPAEIVSQINNLKVGEISDAFESRDEKLNTVYKIITIKSRTPAHQADVKTDYQYIQMLTLQNKQAEKLNEWLIDKVKETYIRINEDYQGCQFRIDGWVK